MPPYAVPGRLPNEAPNKGSQVSTAELRAALSRANELQVELDASIRREGMLEQRVRDLQQQLDSRDFVAQLNRR
jgi:hypothetical protein